MLYKEYIKLEELAIHKIGSKSNMEGVKLSESPVVLNPIMAELLKSYFLLAFSDEGLYKFSHPNTIEWNEVFSFAKEIFAHGNFQEYSKEIAKHLYDRSEHPNIKSGELYVAYFKNCILDGETIDAIGLFKSENKDTYIRINDVDGGYSLESQLGINIKKLDKGCLIFNTHKDDGYLVSVVDNSNRGEAKYWVEDFLQVKPRNDAYTQTQNAMTMCKCFISQLSSDINKAEKAAMMNRVVDGLKHDSVNISNVAESAFGNDLSVGFNSFRNEYQETHDVRFDDTFQGKPESIKRRAVGSMTTIKLDKNFDVSIHGGEQFIERGYDEERGMKYYKLFFNEEK